MLTSGSPKGKNAQASPLVYYFILVLLGIFSAIGLDYIGWKKGEKSYVFSAFTEKKKKQNCMVA